MQVNQQRNTKQKQIVLQAVQGRSDHPTADSIFLDVRACNSRISRGTVYRDLRQLSELGEINHVKVPGADRFDWRTEKHCHLICTLCDKVCDAPAEYNESVDAELARATGYLISRHRTIFEGICPDCQRKLKDKEPQQSFNAL